MHIKPWQISHRKLCLALILKVNAKFQGGIKMVECDWQLNFKDNPWRYSHDFPQVPWLLTLSHLSWVYSFRNHIIYIYSLMQYICIYIYNLQSPVWKEKNQLYLVPVEKVTEQKVKTNTDIHNFFLKSRKNYRSISSLGLPTAFQPKPLLFISRHCVRNNPLDLLNLF